MRLIDADELWEKAKVRVEDNGGLSLPNLYWIIKGLPTIEAEPVVRCKDCKFYDPLDANRPYDCLYMDSIFGDDYCSRGVKLPEPMVYPQVEGITPTVVKTDGSEVVRMTELKPCPFCGGNAKLVEYWLKGVCNKKHFFVQCKQCGVRKDNHHNGYTAQEKAIEGWNKRAKIDEVTE